MAQATTPQDRHFSSHAQAVMASPGKWMLIMTALLFLGVAIISIAFSWHTPTIPLLLVIPAIVPVLVELRFKSRFPTWLHAAYGGFLVAGPLAGAQFNLYGLWPHWDKVMHTTSGCIVGFSTIVLLGSIGRSEHLRLPPMLVVAGILATGGFVAATWEIAEFTSDTILGTHGQNGSLDDTMTDIIGGMTGASLVALLASLHFRGQQVPIIDSLLHTQDFTITKNSA